jgi:hypothetical protein
MSRYGGYGGYGGGDDGGHGGYGGGHGGYGGGYDDEYDDRYGGYDDEYDDGYGGGYDDEYASSYSSSYSGGQLPSRGHSISYDPRTQRGPAGQRSQRPQRSSWISSVTEATDGEAARYDHDRNLRYNGTFMRMEGPHIPRDRVQVPLREYVEPREARRRQEEDPRWRARTEWGNMPW